MIFLDGEQATRSGTHTSSLLLLDSIIKTQWSALAPLLFFKLGVSPVTPKNQKSELGESQNEIVTASETDKATE